jgi:hypothetical protein
LSDKEQRIALAEAVRPLLVQGQAEEACDWILGAVDTASGVLAGLQECRAVAGLLYWNARDVRSYISLVQEVADRLETIVTETSDPEAVKMLGGVFYNLASFAWPGWNESGIVIGPDDLSAGQRAADRCLEMRSRPAFSDVPFGYTLAMAYWIVGSYHLDGALWEAARAAFERARALNIQNGGDGTLSEGYLKLVGLLAHPEDPGNREAFGQFIASLRGRENDKDAAFTADQLETACSVYARPANQ